MTIIAQTPRLIIRVFKPEEEEICLDITNDERVSQYLPQRTREENRVIFRSYLEWEPGSINGRWGIFNLEDGELIGNCLLRLFDDGSESIELGYVLTHKYWGKGIASEMAVAIVAYARNINPYIKFAAVTDLENTPSQRVLEKIGMVRMENYIRNDKELSLFRM